MFITLTFLSFLFLYFFLFIKIFLEIIKKCLRSIHQSRKFNVKHVHYVNTLKPLFRNQSVYVQYINHVKLTSIMFITLTFLSFLFFQNFNIQKNIFGNFKKVSTFNTLIL